MAGKVRISKFLLLVLFVFTTVFNVMICSASVAQKPKVVYMYDKYFSPTTITVSTGQTVIWINKGKLDHTVTMKSGIFDSGHIHSGASISYTFTKPGTYSYVCKMHSFLLFGMRGTVIVK